MIRTQVQLTEEQSRELKRLAATRGVSIAEVIREAIDRLLRSSSFVTWEERKRRALDAAGMYSSGDSDVGAEHDRYLSEIYGR